MRKRGIPAVAIERLPRYYRFFHSLKGKREKISSQELAEELRTSASQVRLDLSYFGGFGRQGYGYRVGAVCSRIGEILGIGTPQEYVIIGAGSLGRAIANSHVFQEAGFNLAGIFDIASERIGTNIGGKIVVHVDTLASFLTGTMVRLAIIATPAESAQGMADVLSASGVQGILNLAPVDIVPGDGIRIANVNLTDKLLSLSWMIANRWEENSGDPDGSL